MIYRSSCIIHVLIDELIRQLRIGKTLPFLLNCFMFNFKWNIFHATVQMKDNQGDYFLERRLNFNVSKQLY